MAKGGIFNILIILALFLAGLMIYLVTHLINSAKEAGRAEAKPAEVEMVNVLVAAQDIEAGTEIQPGMVPPKSVPKDMVTPETVTSFDQIKDKVAGAFIPANDIIFTNKVKSPNQLRKASLIITPGKRLITVPADFQNAVSFMIKNGDHVDILASFKVLKGDKDVEGNWVDREMTVTLMQNVEVFDIEYGSNAPKPKDGNSNEDSGRLGKGQMVTFQVTPQEAERIAALTIKADHIRLTLRRFDDEQIVKGGSIMDVELLKPFLPEPPPPPPAPAVQEVKPAKPKPRVY